MASGKRVLITGCSGGGKSTMLAALAAAGHRTVAEPGRRIVAEERAGDGAALPWIDPAAFARRALAMALADLAEVEGHPGPVFFDRGLVDAAVALDHAAGIPFRATLGPVRHYADTVFLVSPWPAIHARDPDRRHGPGEAIAEHCRIEGALAALGYVAHEVPRSTVAARLAFVLRAVAVG